MNAEVDELLVLWRNLHEDYSPEARRIFNGQSDRFSREMLILTKACERIGLTGTGEEYFGTENDEQQIKHYPLVIKESAEEIMKRYVTFYVFWSREELVDRIARFTDLSQNLERGLILLRTLSQTSDLNLYSDEALNPLLKEVSLEQERLFTKEPTLVVAMDYSDNEYDFFEFREDAALQIQDLRDRFYTWMYDQDGIHPFRIDHKQLYQGNVVADGWYYIQGHQDFVDWVNTQIYHEPVGRKCTGTPHGPPIFELCF
ncbi:hypothetical protein [Saccharibacillus sacchari]|uniref:Uncharacterized protein n=1 Tax=Saccharibacillus sacchari TaxID=456493 RepID=A0ACC6PE95_9BACL